MTKRESFKVILIGSARVGKTSIRKKYLGDTMDKDYNVTLGADFAVKRLDQKILQIWDLAGQPVYKSVRSGYYKGAEGGILVFDIDRPETFSKIPKWLDEMLGVSNQMIPLILVGNKADLRGKNEDQISREEAEKYAKALSEWSGFEVPYIESSALTGKNIDDIFRKLIEEISVLKSTEVGK